MEGEEPKLPAVRSIAWLGRLGWLLVREVKIEKNEFFKGSFPAFENRKVWVERESFRLMEVTTASCPDADPVAYNTRIHALHIKHHHTFLRGMRGELERDGRALLRVLYATRVNEAIAAPVEGNYVSLTESNADAAANFADVDQIAFRYVRRIVSEVENSRLGFCDRYPGEQRQNDEGRRAHGPNENEISHRRVSWQAR